MPLLKKSDCQPPEMTNFQFKNTQCRVLSGSKFDSAANCGPHKTEPCDILPRASQLIRESEPIYGTHLCSHIIIYAYAYVLYIFFVQQSTYNLYNRFIIAMYIQANAHSNVLFSSNRFHKMSSVANPFPSNAPAGYTFGCAGAAKPGRNVCCRDLKMSVISPNHCSWQMFRTPGSPLVLQSRNLDPILWLHYHPKYWHNSASTRIIVHPSEQVVQSYGNT